MAQKYKKPKIAEIVKSICTKNNLNFNTVVQDLRVDYPELWVHERCANCNASMAMYNFTLDALDLILLQKMGKSLKEKMLKGASFTEANKTKVQELDTTYAVKSRTTQCAKLGLIAKVIGKNGAHDTKAGWAITRRGFDCLQGKRVPKSVVVFRNKIEERSQETVTMSEVFATYKENDFKDEITKYAPSAWYNVESYYPNDFTLTGDELQTDTRESEESED